MRRNAMRRTCACHGIATGISRNPGILFATNAETRLTSIRGQAGTLELAGICLNEVQPERQYRNSTQD